MVLDREVNIIREIETPEALIRLRSDDIVHVNFRKNLVLDVAVQERMLVHYMEITNGKKMNFIYSAEEGFVLTKEAMYNGPTVQQRSPILRYALIANNLAYKIIANFYIRVVKPKGNFKLFTTVEGAADWLNSFNDKAS